MAFTIQTAIQEQFPFMYVGCDHPLLTKDKWKPHKALVIVRDCFNGTVLVRRKDNKGCTSSGSQQLFIRFNELQYMPPEGKVEVAEPALGRKFDGDKLEYSLIPQGVLANILRVLGFGKKKYAADNWQFVDNARERYFNATMRHLTSWWEGERVDQETGENHLAHAACCIMFLLWFDNQSTGKS